MFCSGFEYVREGRSRLVCKYKDILKQIVDHYNFCLNIRKNIDMLAKNTSNAITRNTCIRDYFYRQNDIFGKTWNTVDLFVVLATPV